MNALGDKITWLAAFLFAASVFAAPASAQFEEPDTIPRFAFGPFVEANLRGKRADREDTDISFGNGPAFGIRGEYRVSGTVTFGARASYARMGERVEGGATAFTLGEFSQLQFVGELSLKLKPRVPGYLILGGGARIVDSDSAEQAGQWHSVETWTEPVGMAGLGLELGSRRKSLFRLEFRVHFASLGGDVGNFATNSLGTEYSLGLAFLYRP
ncbi:MAG: hypothetical protein JSV41_07200 [Gemmatimonadota bacterium]|nr:MAG: hypothetical protein JSV41_07200 [Gemmatimonadota bacterium]